MEAAPASEAALQPEAVVGFGGNVASGYLLHPDGVHVMYPLGSTIVIKNTKTGTQAFLQGHKAAVSCVALSHDGRRLASGEETYMGFKAEIIVWDVAAVLEEETRHIHSSEVLHRLTLHKVRVQSLSFSPDDLHLLSLGGRDDNNVVVWDLATGEPICGCPASTETALTARWFNHSDKFITGGHYTLRLWEFSPAHRRVRPTDCYIGKLRRVVECVTVGPDDAYSYCGTTTGDILKINNANGRFVVSSTHRYEKGVTSIAAYADARGREHLLIGSGAGVIARLMAPPDNQAIREVKLCQVEGEVTSVTITPDGSAAHAGTARGNTYLVALPDVTASLTGTSHYRRINKVVFPRGCPDLFLTGSFEDIRLWNARTRQELLRIQVPNLECLALAVRPDGSSVVSGWSDGKIRAFFPQSGKLQYVITDAHQDSVTALAVTNSARSLVSGGRDGRVRVWAVERARQTLTHTLKEHKGEVTSVQLVRDDSQCVSSSADGSCVVWDLLRGTRLLAFFASTQFRAIAYHPDESQIMTCGSDRKITYWDATDGTAIRILEGSENELNALAVSTDGSLFVTGGEDRVVKAWQYDEGFVVAAGEGHSAGIRDVVISPDRRTLVSVGDEGAIFVWRMPGTAGAKGAAAAAGRR